MRATLNYLRPGGLPNRRFVAPGAEMNTGVHDPYDVEIVDAWPLSSTLVTDGFTLPDHTAPSSMPPTVRRPADSIYRSRCTDPRLHGGGADDPVPG